MPPLAGLGAEQPCKDSERDAGNEHRGGVGTDTECAEQFLHAGTLFGFYQIDTDDREQHTASGDERRSEDCLELELSGKSGSTQRHGSQDRTGIRLVEVGTHTGHVTYVVTNVVGDSSGVAGIVLGDIVLGLTDQVGTDIRSLGIDTTAYAGKQRLGGRTHTEGKHGGGDGDEIRLGTYPLQQACTIQDEEPSGNIQQGETDDGETHHSTRAESDLETGVKRLTRCVSRTGRCIGGGLHTEETRQAGEETTREEREPYDTVLQMEIRHDGKDDSQHDKDDRHDLVLLLQIRHRTLAHMRGDGTHEFRTLVLAQHGAIEIIGKTQCQYRCCQYDIHQ